MSNKFLKIISVAMCVLLILCFINIIDLKEELTRTRINFNNELSNIRSNMSNVYGEVRNMLEEQVNELSFADWEFGKIDVEAKTAEVMLNVTPKVYSPTSTKVSIMCNDEEYPMTYNTGKYSAQIHIPLFEESHLSTVMLNDKGTVRTQSVDWYLSPKYEAIPSIYSSLSGGCSYTMRDNSYTVTLSGSIHVHIEKKGTYGIKSIEFVEVLDGKEIGRTPFDLSMEAERANDNGTQSVTAPGDAPENSTIAYNESKTFYYTPNKSYDVPFGSMLELYVDVVDEYDLRHRTLVNCLAFTENGNTDDELIEEMMMYIQSETVAIYDKDGKLLYSVDENIFS